MGETNSIARRHGWEYRAHGDHLAPFFEAALNDGCTIWRRVRYTVRPSFEASHVTELDRTDVDVRHAVVPAPWHAHADPLSSCSQCCPL